MDKIKPKFVFNEKTKYKNNIKDKISLGVACCRINNNKPEILLVCKRYTYAYHTFTHGKYNSSSNNELIKLFNGMTLEEKIDILSLNFIQIWYRIWLNSKHCRDVYFPAKNKYESTFAIDGGVRLRNLINLSTNSRKIWEIPKGRKKSKVESEIHCAIREFEEETNVLKKSYKIYPTATRKHSFIDVGVRYTSTYYIAMAKCNIIPKINFGTQDQLDEISDIRWMDIESIRHVDDMCRLEKLIIPIFRFVKKQKRVR